MDRRTRPIVLAALPLLFGISAAETGPLPPVR